MFKYLGIFGLLLFFSTPSQAERSGGAFQNDRLVVGILGGYAPLSPQSLNNSLSLQSTTTTKLNNISSGYLYGGFVQLALPHGFFLEFRYETLDARNLTTGAGSAQNGLVLNQNQIWQLINFWLTSTNDLGVYVGFGAGYPLFNQATIQINSTKIIYDIDRTISVVGKLGLELGIGKSFGLFVESAYVLGNSYKMTSGSGSILKANGRNVEADLGGIRGLVGLGYKF